MIRVQAPSRIRDLYTLFIRIHETICLSSFIVQIKRIIFSTNIIHTQIVSKFQLTIKVAAIQKEMPSEPQKPCPVGWIYNQTKLSQPRRTNPPPPPIPSTGRTIARQLQPQSDLRILLPIDSNAQLGPCARRGAEGQGTPAHQLTLPFRPRRPPERGPHARESQRRNGAPTCLPLEPGPSWPSERAAAELPRALSRQSSNHGAPSVL